MAKERQKATVIKDITREQAEDAFALYATANSNLKKKEAELELKLTKVREGYQDEIAQLTALRDAQFAVLQTYALEHEHLFDKKKSTELTHGIIGFRTATPSLKTLKGFTWKSCVNLVKEFLGDGYVRTTEEVDKESLLAKRDEPEVADLFAKCGFEVRQDETFYVEPKTEEVTAN